MKKRIFTIISLLLTAAMLFSIMPVAFAEDENLAATVMTKETFVSSDNTTLPYRLYVPEDYNPEKEYSFLLFLHGAGNRGSENESQVSQHTGLLNRIIGGEKITCTGEEIDASKEFIIVAPQCAEDKQWVDTPWTKSPDPSYELDNMPQSQYLTAVVELVEKMQETYNLNSSRMYISGLSMGGFGTWDLIMRYPDLFAAAIPMGGAGDCSKAEIIKNTPVWTFHQIHDPLVLSAGTVAMVKALVEVGAEVKFTPYFDTVHNAWTKGYAEPDMLNWLYSHTKEKTKVAFVGDSITYGAGVKDRENEAFVSIIAKEHGAKYEIKNFGKSATSALFSAVAPYRETEEYKASLEFAPDILVIMFGTNDIKYENWTAGKDSFEDDYAALINSYKEVNPGVEIYLGIPPRIFKENVFGERSPAILENEGIPAIYNVSDIVGADVINFFEPTKDCPEYFDDFLHPNAEGNKVFADIVYDKVFANRGKPSAAPAKVITDGASDWAKGEIALAYAAGIMPKGLFGKYKTDITRQEFCEMVVNMLPEDLAATRTASFTDCNNEAVNYAYSVGVINGISDTEFAPNRNATREEMAAMLYRAYKLIAPEAAPTTSGNYPDKDMISSWALDSVDFLNEQGIMKGDNLGNVTPKNNTTCEQAVLLVYRTFASANFFGK